MRKSRSSAKAKRSQVPASPINPEIMHAVELLAGEMWPGVPVIPTMSGGYTDSRWLRNAGIPSYGVSGLFTDPVNSGVHGRNEQVGAKEHQTDPHFRARRALVLRLPYSRILRRPEACRSSLASVGSTGAGTGSSGFRISGARRRACINDDFQGLLPCHALADSPTGFEACG